MAVAYETVKLLKAAGKTPTRAAVVAQMGKLNDASNPFLLPGIAVKTSANEHFPIEQALLQRWSKGSWKSFGGLLRYKPVKERKRLGVRGYAHAEIIRRCRRRDRRLSTRSRSIVPRTEAAS